MSLHLPKRVELSELLGYCDCRGRAVELYLPPAEMPHVLKHTGPYLTKQQDRMFSGKRTPPATHFCYIWDAEETVSSPSWLGSLGRASRAVEGRPPDPAGSADCRADRGSRSSLLVQRFKSWPSWHPKGTPFSSNIKSY